MTLKKLPSIIADNKFDDNGLVVDGAELLVPAYMASQLGFSSTGIEQLHRFYDTLKNDAGILALCPFAACGEYLDFPKLFSLKSIDDVIAFWDEFNDIVGPVNYGELMPRSKLMIAILDGGHAVDDGVCSEIGFYAAAYGNEKPIVGIRSDFRLSENIAAQINPAVRYFIDKGPYKGSFLTGPQAYGQAIAACRSIADEIRQNKLSKP